RLWANDSGRWSHQSQNTPLAGQAGVSKAPPAAPQTRPAAVPFLPEPPQSGSDSHPALLLTRLTREERCGISISAPIQETLRRSDGVGAPTRDVAGQVARMCKRIGACPSCESQPHCLIAI